MRRSIYILDKYLVLNSLFVVDVSLIWRFPRLPSWLHMLESVGIQVWMLIPRRLWEGIKQRVMLTSSPLVKDTKTSYFCIENCVLYISKRSITQIPINCFSSIFLKQLIYNCWYSSVNDSPSSTMKGWNIGYIIVGIQVWTIVPRRLWKDKTLDIYKRHGIYIYLIA
jgi:hypothetical protein